MTKNSITSFKGEYAFLSNFWPCKIFYEGLEFDSVEAAYVAAKTTDMEIRKQIQALDSPGKCKRFGRIIEVRPRWDDMKIGIMIGLVEQKFSRHEDLRKMLLSTGDAEIIEGNTWGDRFWGAEYNSATAEYEGKNLLGYILMNTRYYVGCGSMD